MPRRRAIRRAVAGALVGFVIVSALPIWTAWYLGPREGIGEPAPLWVAVSRIPAARREAPNEFWRLQQDNLIFGLGLVVVAAGVGWGTYRYLTRQGYSEEARDFAEGPAGSLPDGRAEPGTTADPTGVRGKGGS